MVVGRLLSYWEANFLGAMLNFGGVTPILFPPHFSRKKKIVFGPRRWDKMCQCLLGVMIRIVVTASGPVGWERCFGGKANQWCHSFWGALGKGEMFTVFVRTLRSLTSHLWQDRQDRQESDSSSTFFGILWPLMLRHFTNHFPVYRGIPLVNVWTPHLPPPRINRAFRLKTLVENSKPYTGS